MAQSLIPSLPSARWLGPHVASWATIGVQRTTRPSNDRRRFARRCRSMKPRLRSTETRGVLFRVLAYRDTRTAAETRLSYGSRNGYQRSRGVIPRRWSELSTLQLVASLFGHIVTRASGPPTCRAGPSFTRRTKTGPRARLGRLSAWTGQSDFSHVASVTVRLTRIRGCVRLGDSQLCTL